MPASVTVEGGDLDRIWIGSGLLIGRLSGTTYSPLSERGSVCVSCP